MWDLRMFFFVGVNDLFCYLDSVFEIYCVEKENFDYRLVVFCD